MRKNVLICDKRGNVVDAIFGTFFVVGTDGEEFVSLTPKQVEQFIKRYRRRNLEV